VLVMSTDQLFIIIGLVVCTACLGGYLYFPLLHNALAFSLHELLHLLLPRFAQTASKDEGTLNSAGAANELPTRAIW
jgi:hypothetical protein